jgi:hypothetical protein
LGRVLWPFRCFKGLAYGALSCFRGGPTFQDGHRSDRRNRLVQASGLAAHRRCGHGYRGHDRSLLGLPLTSVLLASLYLETDAIALMALVVVAVVVAYDTTARLHPFLPAAPARQPANTAPAAT